MVISGGGIHQKTHSRDHKVPDMRQREDKKCDGDTVSDVSFIAQRTVPKVSTYVRSTEKAALGRDGLHMLSRLGTDKGSLALQGAIRLLRTARHSIAAYCKSREGWRTRWCSRWAQDQNKGERVVADEDDQG